MFISVLLATNLSGLIWVSFWCQNFNRRYYVKNVKIKIEFNLFLYRPYWPEKHELDDSVCTSSSQYDRHNNHVFYWCICPFYMWIVGMRILMKDGKFLFFETCFSKIHLVIKWTILVIWAWKLVIERFNMRTRSIKNSEQKWGF